VGLKQAGHESKLGAEETEKRNEGIDPNIQRFGGSSDKHGGVTLARSNPVLVPDSVLEIQLSAKSIHVQLEVLHGATNEASPASVGSPLDRP
jgi:hypothetical protein